MSAEQRHLALERYAQHLGWTIHHEDEESGQDRHYYCRLVHLTRGDEDVTLGAYVVRAWRWLPWPMRERVRQLHADTAKSANTGTPALEWLGDRTRLPADPTDPLMPAIVDAELAELLRELEERGHVRS